MPPSVPHAPVYATPSDVIVVPALDGVHPPVEAGLAAAVVPAAAAAAVADGAWPPPWPGRRVRRGASTATTRRRRFGSFIRAWNRKKRS